MPFLFNPCRPCCILKVGVKWPPTGTLGNPILYYPACYGSLVGTSPFSDNVPDFSADLSQYSVIYWPEERSGGLVTFTDSTNWENIKNWIIDGGKFISSYEYYVADYNFAEASKLQDFLTYIGSSITQTVGYPENELITNDYRLYDVVAGLGINEGVSDFTNIFSQAVFNHLSGGTTFLERIITATTAAGPIPTPRAVGKIEKIGNGYIIVYSNSGLYTNTLFLDGSGGVGFNPTNPGFCTTLDNIYEKDELL